MSRTRSIRSAGLAAMMMLLSCGAAAACSEETNGISTPAAAEGLPAPTTSHAPVRRRRSPQSTPESTKPADRRAADPWSGQERQRPASTFSLRGRRIVAYYGAGTTDVLGVLGRGTPEQAWRAVAAQARAYSRPGRPTLPAFELIASVASATAGPDGKFRSVVPDSVIARYAQVAHRHHGLLILDVQPGRSDFLTESKRFTRWLRRPDVALALDPEWRMNSSQVPGQVIGSVTAAEINRTSAWLDGLTAQANLPPKLLLLHKFTDSMITQGYTLKRRSHLVTAINMDGFGEKGIKIAEYKQFYRQNRFHMGLKLFFRQDVDMMTPREVLALRPAPMIVDYQ